MKKSIIWVLAVGLYAISGAAGAWWGGPFNSWFDDFFAGDGWFNFSFSMSGGGHGRTWNRYYDYYGPYGYPYAGAMAPAYGYPQTVAPQLSSEELRTQARSLQQAVEAQRRLAEKMAQPSETREIQPAPVSPPPAAESSVNRPAGIGPVYGTDGQASI